jgi:hypothetical protein
VSEYYLHAISSHYSYAGVVDGRKLSQECGVLSNALCHIWFKDSVKLWEDRNKGTNGHTIVNLSLP